MSPIKTFPGPRLILFAWVVLACFLGLMGMSPVPGWPDADEYPALIEQNRWVAHPPGYLPFVALAHGGALLLGNSYHATVAVGWVMALASIPCIYALCRKISGTVPGLWLATAYTFSWLPIMLGTTGTPHSADLLLPALLLCIVWSPSWKTGRASALMAFFLVFTLAAGFRLTTGIMLGPACAAAAWIHRRRAATWLGALLALACIWALQALSAKLWGEPGSFQTSAAHMHEGNKISSLWFAGINAATLLNVFRTALWALMAFPLAWALAAAGTRTGLKSLFTGNLRHGMPAQLAVTLLCLLGPLGVTATYLATHPGYLAPVAAPLFALSAWIVHHNPGVKARLLVAGTCASVALWAALWFGPWLVARPEKPWQAAWNGLVGQYCSGARRAGTWKSLSSWLDFSGNRSLAPRERLQQIDNPQGPGFR